MVLALAAGSLVAAQDQPRPRVTVVVKSPAPATPLVLGQPTLRRPIGLALNHATSAGKAAPLGSFAALVLAQSDLRGAASLRGLNPLSASAKAAQCRAQCGEARYVCAAHDAGDCDTVWGRCVVGCSGVSYARTPDLALGASAPVPH